ncbi:MAG: hypothetical protein AAF609_14385 [Cyanobacteria bacterium P01_C01_bin.120]
METIYRLADLRAVIWMFSGFVSQDGSPLSGRQTLAYTVEADAVTPMPADF